MTNQQDMPALKEKGLKIYMGVLGLQELIVVVFTAMGFAFQRKLMQQEQRHLEAGQGVSMAGVRAPHNARRPLTAVYVVLGLITLRIIFRLVEFSQWYESYISTHEWFPYLFDAVTILMAMIFFSTVHPGTILRGPRSDFSEERRAKKEEKREKQEMKKVEKERKKERKNEARVTVQEV